MNLLAHAVQAAEPTGQSHSPIVSLLWIAVIAVAAPLVSKMLRGYLPGVVVLLGAGALIGPYMADFAASTGGVELVSQLGLAMLFLLAGFELDPKLVRGKAGRVAWETWIICLVFAFALVSLVATRGVESRIAIAIALTSTALGTLLPIITQAGILNTQLGKAVMRNGAVGELGPVVAISVLLSSKSPGSAIAVVVMFIAAVVVIGFVPVRLLDRFPRLVSALSGLSGGASQFPVRVVVMLLLVLMALAQEFDLDLVLGAFAAGMILRQFVVAGMPSVQESLESMGYGLLIPVFFVVSGMGIDLHAVTEEPGKWLLFVATIAVARGIPVFLSEWLVPHGDNLQTPRERVELAFYSATGLPIIVAVTEVATSAHLITDQLASLLVAAGATTVLLFPLAARLIGTTS
ncbi:cation:proton antiporter [Nocardia camponoti]|uniref:Potassium transporter Kef n=1 Tax=Nocardia camponoti TaxID=1616106 RepID=A0A917VEB1_9NOCA|nr:cation:proton antiporter [Nocardia camponoti]GGK67289.1 potassium transporter Kef [Nocardia camponoti]